MSKRAQKEEKILQEFQTISKEMAPKPKYFKNIILAFQSYKEYFPGL